MNSNNFLLSPVSSILPPIGDFVKGGIVWSGGSKAMTGVGSREKGKKKTIGIQHV